MKVSEQGLALIRRFEGFSPHIYLCPAGKPTIGYGHVIRKDEQVNPPIGQDEADKLLKNDVEIAEQAINRLVRTGLNQPQFDALVSFVYNIGIQAFEKSTLLRMLNRKEYQGAAQEFCRWVYVNGRRSKGLLRRRDAETMLFQEKTDFS
jgi:lysozyme